MSRWQFTFFGLGLALGLCFILSCGSSSNSSSSSTNAVGTQVVVSGLSLPLDLEQSGDNSGRLFVVEQGGLIKIIQNGSVLPTPFLDISAKVIDQSEMGLLGVTFHPSFATNGKFYVNYVRNNAGQFQSVISEFQVSAANPNQADPASERILLTVD